VKIGRTRMENVNELLKQYHDIKTQMYMLQTKGKEIREKLLGYLIDNQKDRMIIPPYKMWFYEIPKYDYAIKNIYDLLKGSEKFFDILTVKSKSFQELLSSNDLDDDSVNDLLNTRTVKSSSKSFYVREEK